MQLDTFVSGFDRSYERLRSGITSHETAPDEVFVSLFEALHWIVALDDLAGASGAAIAADGDDLQGLRFARNRAGHQWASAIVLRDIPSPPAPIVGGRSRHGRPTVRITRPASVWAWVWVEESALPLPAPRFRRRAYRTQRAAYIGRLLGVPAHEVLDRLHDALGPLRTP